MAEISRDQFIDLLRQSQAIDAPQLDPLLAYHDAEAEEAMLIPRSTWPSGSSIRDR